MSANSESMKQWRIRNPDYNSNYYLANRDSIIVRGRRWREENPDRMKFLNIRNYKLNREKVSASIRAWRADNPEKVEAYSVIYRGIKSGKVKRPILCSKCGSIYHLDYHHPDYSKPLETATLCRTCHKRLHAEVLV